MDTKEEAKQRLVNALVSIHFSERYYGYYEYAYRRMPSEPTFFQEHISHSDLVQAIAATGLTFKFDTKEKFFYSREQHGDSQFGLHISFVSYSVELVLFLKTPQGHLGGPFSLLAKQAALQHDSTFSYSPPYPKLLFYTSQELHELMQFSVLLFEEAKTAFLASATHQEMAAMVGN